MTKVERAILENQRAIMLVLMHVKEIDELALDRALLMERFDRTSELTLPNKRRK